MLLQKSGSDQSRGHRTGGLAMQIAMIDVAGRRICGDDTSCFEGVFEARTYSTQVSFQSLLSDYMLLAADAQIGLRKNMQ